MFRFLSLLICAGLATIPAPARAQTPTSSTVAARFPPVDPAQYSHPVRVACVGDSITYGMTIRDREADSYPAQLQKALGEKWIVKNFGVNAMTLLKNGDRPYWGQQAYKDALAFNPDVVVIMLGTNDCKPENWTEHGKEFIGDYGALIDSFEALESKPRIWAALPPPCFPGAWTITNDSLKNNVAPQIRKAAQENPVGLIDVYAALDGHAGLFPDKVHPNAAGAALIAKAVQEAIAKHP